MPLFGYTKILHTLVGMRSAALVAAVALLRQGEPNVPQGINEVHIYIYRSMHIYVHISRGSCLCGLHIYIYIYQGADACGQQMTVE